MQLCAAARVTTLGWMGARGIKTTNFDACRDLNGRRLRHVNAEAQLREWEASAEERKQKKAEQRARSWPPVARERSPPHAHGMTNGISGSKGTLRPAYVLVDIGDARHAGGSKGIRRCILQRGHVLALHIRL